MAQTGFTPISNYYSSTATNVPTAGNLVAGELAINTADGKLFYKDSSGVVQTMASKATTAGTYSSITTSNLTIGTTQLGAGNASIMKNRIINGAMVIDQRNAGAAVTGTPAYPVDRWSMYNNTDGTYSAQQDTSAPIGFSNSLKVTVTSADASLGSTQYLTLTQNIEGFNTADLGFGTADAKTITVSFWVKSSLTGAFGASIQNSAQNRCYPFSYTISAANTWEQKSVTIAGDTTGTWIGATNGVGLRLIFGFGVGSTFSGTANAWTGSSYIFAPTGAVPLISTNGSTWQATGVQLEVGSSATGFEYVNYQTSLANCQRYYYKLINGSGNSRVLSGYITTTTQGIYVLNMPVSMRTSPTALETNGTASNYAIAHLNTETNCSAIPSYNDSTINTVSVIGTVTAGLVSGGGCQLRYTNAAAYLAVSAEL